jgi:hypothetical protein
MSTIYVNLIAYLRHICMHVYKYRDLNAVYNIFYATDIRITISRSDFQVRNQKGILLAHYTYNVNSK